MTARLLAMTLVACRFSSWGFAQSSSTDDTYTVPRTEHGHPDFQGVWSTRFNTGLERPEGLPLVLSPEQATGFALATPRPYQESLSVILRVDALSRDNC